MPDQTRALVYGLATVMLWSTMATAFKLTLREISPAALVMWASVFSTISLGGLLAARGRLVSAMLDLRKRWRTALLFGLVNPVVYYLVLFKAYDLLPAQVVRPVNGTWAITMALLAAVFLGHRLTRTDILATAIAYAGVVVITTRGQGASAGSADSISLFGVALALVSTLLWAAYWIASTRDTRDAVTGLFQNFLTSLPVLAAAIWILEGSGAFAPSGPALLGAAYIGSLEMGLTFALWLAALKHATHAGSLSTLIFLSQPIALVFIHFILGESIHPNTYWGFALILAGLGLQNWARFRRTPQG
ncbi:EamA/RhaT family transporter [Oceanidesulfovibrio indonesiensis]|uniref:EamA/RhaT family transporter n=1 Tax=Oceanidesulfovibrio indonesiensis TaxID=54767 RepID=A0A7M3MF50_9BACT|nr:DMT family transporter [Oceanidesulfovibrio indonesiensis]TVM17639.1 EamA/RhaT family transporter [Oceanidesulfovibrio indonesiensis]